MSSQFSLPHIWSHGLWHGTRRGMASFEAGVGAQDSFSILSQDMASTCMLHPCKKMWSVCWPAFAASTRGMQISHPYTCSGHKVAPHVCTPLAPIPPRPVCCWICERSLWLLTIAHHRHLFQKSRMHKIKSGTPSLQAKRLLSLYIYNLQSYMFGWFVYIVHKLSYVFILGYEQVLK